METRSTRKTASKPSLTTSTRSSRLTFRRSWRSSDHCRRIMTAVCTSACTSFALLVSFMIREVRDLYNAVGGCPAEAWQVRVRINKEDKYLHDLKYFSGFEYCSTMVFVVLDIILGSGIMWLLGVFLFLIICIFWWFFVYWIIPKWFCIHLIPERLCTCPIKLHHHDLSYICSVFWNILCMNLQKKSILSINQLSGSHSTSFA